MKFSVNGVEFDTERCELVSQSENADGTWKKLYKTPAGEYFFVEKVVNVDYNINLCSEETAKDFCNLNA